MTAAAPRHPFLDDLAEDVTLTSSVLRGPVRGRDLALAVVKAGGTLYREQRPQFLGSVDRHGYFEYEAVLTDGQTAQGLVSMVRNEAGEVTDLHIAFSPLGAVLSIATALRGLLDGRIAAELLL